MSKQISFPLLEITTLIVVLFACVLVVVPGFDEFTTSMLFAPEQGATRSNEVASTVSDKNDHGESLDVESSSNDRLSMLDRGAFEFSDERDPLDKFEQTFEAPAAELDRESPMETPANELELLPVPSANSELLVDNPLDTTMLNDSGQNLESIIEQDSSFEESDDWSDELADASTDLNSNDQYEEMAIEPNWQDENQVDVPTETAPGEPSQSPDFVVNGNPADAVLARQGTASADSTKFTESPPTEVTPLDQLSGVGQTLNPTFRNDVLPRIIIQVGNERKLQADPKIIRMPSVFESDVRVVMNPTYSQTADQSDSVQPPTDKDEAPNTEPYQIRTTALPSGFDSNDNDFVPQR